MVGRYLLINIVRISRVSYIVLLLTICITFFEASFTLFVKCRREEGRAVDRPGRTGVQDIDKTLLGSIWMC
jgi:hypothetical protein